MTETTNHSDGVIWVEYSDSDLLAFYDADGSPLMEADAGDVARAVGVPVWELHNKLKSMVDSGRLYRWDIGTYTFCRTSSRSDQSRFHAAKIGFFRHGRKGVPQSTDHQPEEVDFDVDFGEAQYDYMES